MLSSQLSDDMETLAQQRGQLQEQIDTVERRQRLLKEQLREDSGMEGLLVQQIEKLTQGRQETLRGLQASLAGAHETGRDTLSKGLESMDVSGSVDTTTVGMPMFLQIGEEESAARDDPEDFGEVYPILTSNAERVEKQHELLQDQLEKVHITIQHTTLTIAKLNSDLKLFEVMKSAVKGQIEELDKGEHQAIKNMFETLKSQSEAQQAVLKSMTSKTSSEETEVEKPSEESNETEARASSSTSLAP